MNPKPEVETVVIGDRTYSRTKGYQKDEPYKLVTSPSDLHGQLQQSMVPALR